MLWKDIKEDLNKWENYIKLIFKKSVSLKCQLLPNWFNIYYNHNKTEKLFPRSERCSLAASIIPRALACGNPTVNAFPNAANVHWNPILEITGHFPRGPPKGILGTLGQANAGHATCVSPSWGAPGESPFRPGRGTWREGDMKRGIREQNPVAERCITCDWSCLITSLDRVYKEERGIADGLLICANAFVRPWTCQVPFLFGELCVCFYVSLCVYLQFRRARPVSHLALWMTQQSQQCQDHEHGDSRLTKERQTQWALKGDQRYTFVPREDNHISKQSGRPE